MHVLLFVRLYLLIFSQHPKMHACSSENEEFCSQLITHFNPSSFHMEASVKV